MELNRRSFTLDDDWKRLRPGDHAPHANAAASSPADTSKLGSDRPASDSVAESSDSLEGLSDAGNDSFHSDSRDSATDPLEPTTPTPSRDSSHTPSRDGSRPRMSRAHFADEPAGGAHHDRPSPLASPLASPVLSPPVTSQQLELDALRTQ
eukprot:3010983-Prymnesium_polylepis.1